MAIELESGVKAEEEIKTLENYTKEEETKQQIAEQKALPQVDLSDFKAYANILHHYIINKVFQLNFAEKIINQLDSDLIKIIEKRFPNIGSQIGNYAPEMGYIGTFATGLLLSQANKEKETENANIDILSIPEVPNPNVQQRINN